MAQVKRDDVKQSWEDTEFPLVCETCLGDNPYVRMTKEPFGKKCQVCETPFTVFAWQAGTKGRLKRVEICKSCAQAKNVCQVCIYDLQYGLPVKVRDKVLRETARAAIAGPKGGDGGAGGGSGGVGAGLDPTAMIPQSNANRAWFTAQQQRMVEAGQGGAGAAAMGGSELAHAKLREMAVMEPRYERNLPKLCSFFARGECDRGSTCPFRHEMPRDRGDPMSKVRSSEACSSFDPPCDVPLSYSRLSLSNPCLIPLSFSLLVQQNTKDRFYGTSDPVANKILGRKRRQEELQEKKDEATGYDRAPCTLYMRFQGDPPYPTMAEMDIRDLFYPYGEIVSVRIQSNGQAFVEYTSPEATELAISSMNRKEMLGRTLFCSWARAPKRGEGTGSGASNDIGGDSSGSGTGRRIVAAPTGVRPLPPPGGSGAPISSSLPTVKLPPEVAAIVAARKQKLESGGSRPGTASVPRPSGGLPRPGARPGGLYPSADPQRLGSKTTAPSD
jgi:pre-mRNA-splicing factor RBM22/SLT11